MPVSLSVSADADKVRTEIREQIERGRSIAAMPRGTEERTNAETQWRRFVYKLLESRFSDPSVANDFRADTTFRPKVVFEGPQRPDPHDAAKKGIAFLEALIESLHLYVREEKNPFAHITLTTEQEDVLCRLVEAEQAASPQRMPFYLTRTFDGTSITHIGLPDTQEEIYEGDIFALADADLVRVERRTPNDLTFDLRPLASKYREWLKRRQGQPIIQVEHEIRRYLDTAQFRDIYPKAYERWVNAEELIWQADAAQHTGDVGFRCRETMQAFADEIVARQGLSEEVNLDKAKTIDRISVIINQCRSRLGDTASTYLDALFSLWRANTQLMQRQVHVAEHGEQPTLEDARRLVFATLFVMTEIDRAVGHT